MPYSAKPDYQLQPGAAPTRPRRQFCAARWRSCGSNEEGIKADWDVEFLHDYRTAVRRTRSALSQITDVFPPETTQHYKEAFGLLGEQ